MSISDNSTIAPSSDIDGSFQSLDDRTDTREPGAEVGVAKKNRRTRRPPRSTAVTCDGNRLEGSESMQQRDDDFIQGGQGDEAVISRDRSPYADAQIIFLHVGPNATPFSVHSTILMKSAVLAAQYDPFSVGNQHVPIPELDEFTTHTLVHYLYTDKYESLSAPPESPKPTLSSYKVGTCVYCAAVRYQLPGLAKLAKEKIALLGEDVSISDILVMARDHAFPLLPEDEVWYPSYLEDAVRSAMTEDPEPFRRPDFITQVEGNSRLLQVIWRTVMSNYASAPVAPKLQDDEKLTLTTEASPAELAPVKGPEPERKDNASAVDFQNLASFDEPQPAVTAHASSPEPPSAEVTTASDVSLENALNLDDIEPTLDTHSVPEPFTDELGFESSKTYQKMGKKEVKPESQASHNSESERSAHKRSDSVMQVEEASTTSKEEGNEMQKIADIAPLVVNDSNETATTQKKSKKSKKKKSSTVF